MAKGTEQAATTDALFRSAVDQALSDAGDPDAYWSAVSQLQSRDPHDVWARVVPLAGDRDPRLRSLVPDVIRYLGGSERPMREPAVQLVTQMLETEQVASVIAAGVGAFIDLDPPSMVDRLRRFVSHPDAKVRHVVACAIATSAPQAIPELLHLSRDESDDVRNWATFGLGSMLGSRGDSDLVDTEAVRSALADRLDDSHAETRAEAVLGLAVRGDERAIPVVARELASGTAWTHHVEAAELLADARLHDVLVAVSDAGTAPADLTAAIAACTPHRSK